MDDQVKVDPKAVAFSRVATQRTRHALAAIERLETLTSSRYSSTLEQRGSILDALRKAVDGLSDVYFPDPAPEPEEEFSV